MTQKTDAIADEMLRKAEQTKEEVVDKGGNEHGTMTLRTESPGNVTVYDTRTGISAEVNLQNLKSILRKTRTDGTPFYNLEQKVKPKQGTYPCLLAASDPNREHYDTLGFPVCQKDTLSAPLQVRRHMMKRHKVEWGAIEEERRDKKEAATEAFQRSIIEQAAKPPLYVKDKTK